MLNTLAYYLHDLNPVIVEFGWLKPRWYGFAYLLGFLVAYLLLKKLAKDGMLRIPLDKVPDLVLNCCIFGVLIGGRLGYVLFYDLPNALKHDTTPLLWQFTNSLPYWGVLRVMDGGMSAHGGILFTILTLMWFARKYRPLGANLVNIGDAACMVVPVGLCFGRIANFINGELYGHISKLPWAVKFPSEYYAATNEEKNFTAEQMRHMQEAVAQYLAEHPQEFTVRQAQEFLANNAHDSIGRMVVDQFGQIAKDNGSTDIAKWLAEHLGKNPEAIQPWDIGQWWQHSTGAFHEFLYNQFNLMLHPRHPSQLYEALLEGLLLFVICWMVGRLWKKDGMAGGAFLTFYPIMRIIGEQFRVGDTPKEIFGVPVSLGVIYSFPMLIAGLIYWIYWIRRDRRIPWKPQEAAAPRGTTQQNP